MTLFQALLLGIVQGLTEFFPVSSSAHLKIAKFFLGIDSYESLVLFDLICHMGTLCALLFFLRKRIFSLFFNNPPFLFSICLAILPLGLLYFLLKPIRDYFSDLSFVPLFLLITSILLFITSYKKEKKFSNGKTKIKDVLFIGIMQAMALIPGISRSGSTISAACMRGWHIQEAILFSFLLAIPTVLGGSILESYKVLSRINVIEGVAIAHYSMGFISSFIIGLFSIRYIFSLTDKKKILPFAWYCLLLAGGLIIYFTVL